MKKIEVWETTDGSLFRDEILARMHEDKVKGKASLQHIFNINEDKINKYVFDNHIDDLRIKPTSPDDIKCYFYDSGWNCDSKSNVVGKCIYIDGSYMGEDECLYCGQPEERK